MEWLEDFALSGAPMRDRKISRPALNPLGYQAIIVLDDSNEWPGHMLKIIFNCSCYPFLCAALLLGDFCTSVTSNNCSTFISHSVLFLDSIPSCFYSEVVLLYLYSQGQLNTPF